MSLNDFVDGIWNLCTVEEALNLIKRNSKTVILGSAALFLCYVYRKGTRKPKGFPPGPPRRFLVGSETILRRKINVKETTGLFKKFGELIGIYLFHQPIILLANVPLLRDVLHTKGDAANARLVQPGIEELFPSNGILLSKGEHWKVLRRFTLTTLRDFGMGKIQLEEHIIAAMDNLKQKLTELDGKPVDPINPLLEAVSTVIGRMILGPYFDNHLEDAMKMVTNQNAIFAGARCAALAIMFGKWMKKLPFDIFGIRRLEEMAKFNQDVLYDSVEWHKKTLKENETRDFIDAFLHEIRRAEETGSSDLQYFTLDNLRAVVGDLFAGGTDTTATTIRWILLYMASYPDVQEEAHKELVDVLGDSTPGLRAKPQLPFTDSVALEILRLVTILPSAVAHELIEDIEVQGYSLKTGMVILPHLWYIHHNAENFSEPMEFKPRRFINDGKAVAGPNMVPFGVGKRSCPGEALARMELFMMTSYLLQSFRVGPEPGKKPNLEGLIGVTHYAPPQNLVFTPRI